MPAIELTDDYEDLRRVGGEAGRVVALTRS
jgi:hypothetical protein